MRKPNFLIIGAPKAGTTSLFMYLQQHPDIGFSHIKEPKYFSFDKVTLKSKDKLVQKINKFTIREEVEYLSLFENRKEKFIGEASPNYLHSQIAPERIFKFNPDMKLIVVLRNPIFRAYSDWKFNIEKGMEPVKNFKKALDLIPERKRKGILPYSDYLIKGKYGEHLTRYLDYLPSENLHVLFFEDFIAYPNVECNRILNFLGIPDQFGFQTENRHMQNSFSPKFIFLRKFSKRLNNYLPAGSSLIDYFNRIGPLKQRDSLYLQQYYVEDIEKLKVILGEKLDQWK